MSEKKKIGNGLNTKSDSNAKSENYKKYTDQGASMDNAHTDYAEWHENNHKSFFNMNNSMGMIKIVIIGAIIVIIIVVLSPLFKLLKGVVGVGNTLLHLLGDLLKACEDQGTCNAIVSSTTTQNPNGKNLGKCDGKGSVAKGASCYTRQLYTKGQAPSSPAPNSCGSKASTLCTLALAFWIFMAPIMALGAYFGKLLLSLFKKKEQTPAEEQGEADSKSEELGDEVPPDASVADLTESIIEDNKGTEAETSAGFDAWYEATYGKYAGGKSGGDGGAALDKNFPQTMKQAPKSSFEDLYNKSDTDGSITWTRKGGENFKSWLKKKYTGIDSPGPGAAGCCASTDAKPELWTKANNTYKGASDTRTWEGVAKYQSTSDAEISWLRERVSWFSEKQQEASNTAEQNAAAAASASSAEQEAEAEDEEAETRAQQNGADTDPDADPSASGEGEG